VLPNSTNQLRLALTTHHVLAYSHGQFLSLPSSRRFDEVLTVARGAISTVQGQNGAEKQNSFLRRLGLNAPGVSFIIDNAWVRIFVCRWDEALKTNQDFFRYAEIEFQRRFHLSPKQWLLVPDQLRPAGETVWCAYEREHLTALEALSQSAGLRIESVLPTIIAEVAAVEFEAGSSPAIYVSAGEQSQNACWMNNDRIRDIVLLNNRIDDRGLLDVFVERQVIPSPKQISVIRPQGARVEVLRTLVVGETLKTVASAIEQSNDLAIKEQVPA
jgi:hypothetical protein